MDYPHLPYHPDNDVFVTRHLSVACCPADPPLPSPAVSLHGSTRPRVLEDFYQLPAPSPLPLIPPPPFLIILPSCFSAWKHPRVLEDYQLPQCMLEVCGESTTATTPMRRSCPFGDGVLRLQDAVLAGGGLWGDGSDGRGAGRCGGCGETGVMGGMLGGVGADALLTGEEGRVGHRGEGQGLLCVGCCG